MHVKAWEALLQDRDSFSHYPFSKGERIMNITDYVPALCQGLVSLLPFPSSSLCEVGTISLYLWRNEDEGVNAPAREQVETQTQVFLPEHFTLLPNHMGLLAFTAGEEDRSGGKKRKRKQNKTKRETWKHSPWVSMKSVKNHFFFLDL